MSDDHKASFFSKLFKRKQTGPKDLTMRHVLSVSKKRRFPTFRQWRQLPSILTQGEKQTIMGALLVITLSLTSLGVWYFITHRVEIPTVGGEYTEALIGEPQLINPLYASSNDADADIASLVFSGLLKWDPNQGLVNDLAESVDISEDGTVYTVKLRKDAVFHNGEEVRARDVLFTINAIQNPAYRSPLEVSFRGVEVSQIDDKTVAFILEEPFAPFLTTLTVGILPAGSWATIAPKNALLASLNLEPIGSGPYQFAEFSKDKAGNILTYTLKRNPNYYGEGPMIERLTFKFYQDADEAIRALENRNVEGMSFVPTDLEEEAEKIRGVRLLHPTIPRETVLFFNEDAQPILANKNVRRAIALAINKEAIVQDVLDGNGTVIDGPILPGMIGYHPDIAKIPLDRVQAAKLLEEEGYVVHEDATFRTNPKAKPTETEQDETEDTEETSSEESTNSDSADLTLVLTTVQSPEFIRTAELLADQLKTIGIKIEINVVESEAFFDDVVAPRQYELLLTGVLLGVDEDPFPFWHSSQVGENGLNLAGYANRNVDTLLEEARLTTNEEERAAKYREFQDLLVEDIPAVFLYQSTYAYAISEKIRNVQIDRIAIPSHRFAKIESWYIKTKKAFK